MVQQRRVGLGKGLGALIPTGPVVEAASPPSGSAASGSPADEGPKPVAGAYFLEIPVAAIIPNPRQPRDIFDEDALRELADSIREVGLLQPIVVRAVGQGRYELIMGERRWRASQLLEMTEIPAIVRGTQDDEMLREALIENLQREQLNALEEAAAYRQLLDDFGATHEQLAQRVGRSRSHITNTLRLLNLPGNVQTRVAAGTISAGHARALLPLSDPAAQEHLASRIVAEGLSVRTVEEIVSMGEATAAPAPRPRRAKDAPEPVLAHLAHRLSDHFETRVKVDLGRHKGRIVVEFATMDDLERIIGAMAPQAANAFDGTDD
ncbi:chromosome partitioning protein ParB [Sphaerisporangium melleum]|uniref:Chromosome partitioning protein ParB n=1 Tax=Sphaerisporangium melleum TaxID=321316 RepID=A0A917RK71_9ACTN|nr:ParB/RepB/Spo0J family partition protein [Sphaerisporangium melleum]GGL11816.1 chromosome partitioning protein ParB [Sphaerisporangium melleum]GII71697.1 chromosome partitioning protein ParB [Sphaerisporangium melleum]